MVRDDDGTQVKDLYLPTKRIPCVHQDGLILIINALLYQKFKKGPL